MELFAILCPTCNARLKVRNASAIGQILNCPKCGSMVQVAAPAGWQPPSAEQIAAQAARPATQTPAAQAPAAQRPATQRPATKSSGELTPQPVQPDATTASQPPGNTPAPPRRRWENEVRPGEQVTGTVPASASSGGWRLGSSSGGLSSPDVSSSGDLAAAAAGQNGDAPSGRLRALPAMLAPYLSTSWAKWTLLAGAPLLAVVVATGVWLARGTPVTDDQAQGIVESGPETSPIEQTEEPTSEPADVTPQPEPIRLSRRWLPTDAQAVVSLRPNVLLSQPAATVVLDRTAALWEPSIDKLVSALGIEPRSLQRVTWSSTDVTAVGENDWLANAVVTLELDRPAGPDLRGIRDSEPLDWKLAESPVRALKSRAWPHPFAVVDKRLVVTGPEERLRELSAREEHRLANDALQQLIDSFDAKHAAVAAIDLRAMREAESLPHWLGLVEVLHAEADDCNLLRALPLAFGLSLGLDERIDLEIDLACDAESSAEQVQAALDRVLKAVERTLGGETEGLTARLLAGQINAASAAELKHFLTGSQLALANRSSGIRDSIVWGRLQWQGELPRLAAGFLASIPQIEASRLAAARSIDEEHHRALLAGLEGYVKAEGGFPAGAAGAALLPPDTRLSWQATLLPYYGHLDWHGELNFARAWNDPINQRATRRPLDLMINPALGPSTTTGGFPVTHYVGVAGLGADAGELDADDPRAGVFGFRPRYAPAQIPDGVSNTIVLAGVSQKLGPWARGGSATVRGLSQRPYINGPDGFGSGQPDGMLVGMADGSVRFLPKDIDAEVLERLVTMGDGARQPEPLAAASKRDDGKMPLGPSAEAPPPPKAKHKQPQGDLARRLADRIPSIELKTTTLSELVDLLSQLSTVPITLDANGLAAAGVAPDARVSLNMTDATVGEVLDEALRPYGLKYIEAGDQLIVTDARQPAEQLASTRFDVADLIAPESDESGVARMVETFVAPTAWQASGGASSIEVADRALTVEQTPAITSEVADFLDKLRMARALPIARREGRRLSLATRWARARDKLATPVTANFAEAAPLTEIAAHLQKIAGIEIVFDGVGLAAAGVSPAARTKFNADRQALADALDQLLATLELGYRIVNGQRIEITSAHAVAADLELEFYPVKPLLPAGQSADEFAARLRKKIAPSSWREHGGASTLAIDGVSSYLIVLAPQAAQIELERWLDEQLAR